MVGCSDNDGKDEGWVSHTEYEIEDLPKSVFAHFSLLEGSAEETGMIDHRHANAEGVAKMHRGHSSKLVDEFSAHPNTLCIVVADSVEEAVFRRQEARRHAWVYNKGQESTEVGEGEGAASDGKCVERGRHVVVPANKSHSPWNVDQRIALVQHCKRILMSMHEPLLYILFPDREQETQQAILFGLQHGDSVFLCHIPYPAPSEELSRRNRGHPVEGVVDDPIKHFDQEWEALQYAAMYIVPETPGAGCGDLPAAYASNFGRVWVLGCVDFVELAVAVGLYETVGGLPRGVIEVTLALRRRAEDFKVSFACDEHGEEQYAGDHNWFAPSRQLPRWFTVPLAIVR